MGLNKNNLYFKNNSRTDDTQAFLQLSQRIVELGHLASVQLHPFDNEHLLHFNLLTPDKKHAVLFGMKNFVHICEVTIDNGSSLRDTKALTWFALKEMDLRFNSDIFETIESDDILEVYTQDNIQIFRNFKFLELVSYTLEDIFCRPWTDLFSREDVEKTSAIITTVSQFYTKENLKTISLKHLGVHRVQEACSPHKYKYDYIIKYASPLFDKHKQPAGFIVTETAEIVSPNLLNNEKDLMLHMHYKKNSPELIR